MLLREYDRFRQEMIDAMHIKGTHHSRSWHPLMENHNNHQYEEVCNLFLTKIITVERNCLTIRMNSNLFECSCIMLSRVLSFVIRKGIFLYLL